MDKVLNCNDENSNQIIDYVLNSFFDLINKYSYIHYYNEIKKTIKENNFKWEDIFKFINSRNVSENEVFCLFYVGFLNEFITLDCKESYGEISKLIRNTTIINKLLIGIKNYLDNKIENLSSDREELGELYEKKDLDYNSFANSAYLVPDIHSYPLVHIMGFLKYEKSDYFMEIIKNAKWMKFFQYLFNGAINIDYEDKLIKEIIDSENKPFINAIQYYCAYNLDFELRQADYNNSHIWFEKIELIFNNFTKIKIQFVIKYIFHFNKYPRKYADEALCKENISELIEFLKINNTSDIRKTRAFFQLVTLSKNNELNIMAKDKILNYIENGDYLLEKISIDEFKNWINTLSEKNSLDFMNELINIYKRLRVSEFDEQIRTMEYDQDKKVEHIICSIVEIYNWKITM
ncbi:hypothetical protein CDLVIII_0525 [Clostridium sp. DL-VIII]|uniref:hypothetical protein n=1 Tax=Clostridium sp. DL-VIII TaxID=641107 RepID=UPI00023AF4D8|nr:hypothetical protein [Clostridium sp. DL-VIII]EHI97260.1 hypothetical protein CDLVIII_0525 [Clostridium sp. DL-VIII]